MNKQKKGNKSTMLVYFRKLPNGKTEKEEIESKLKRKMTGRDLIEPYLQRMTWE